MRFVHLITGWEGSVADSTLWVEAIKNGAVKIPEGKYVLGDAGFPNCDVCLTPYRGVRYHLQEWARGNKRPQNKEELFNLRHSRLRNVIERIFGVLKAKFKILLNPRPFKLPTQVRVVSAICILYNILVSIQEEGILEEDEAGQEEGEGEEEEVIDGDQEVQIIEQGYRVTRGESLRAGRKRDDIAKAI